MCGKRRRRRGLMDGLTNVKMRVPVGKESPGSVSLQTIPRSLPPSLLSRACLCTLAMPGSPSHSRPSSPLRAPFADGICARGAQRGLTSSALGRCLVGDTVDGTACPGCGGDMDEVERLEYPDPMDVALDTWWAGPPARMTTVGTARPTASRRREDASGDQGASAPRAALMTAVGTARPRACDQCATPPAVGGTPPPGRPSSGPSRRVPLRVTRVQESGTGPTASAAGARCRRRQCRLRRSGRP